LFTQNGSDPEAHYALHHVDAASPAARNTYAVALYDAHSPDILFGEVLAKPGWSHPTLSQEEIRKNGGVAPPPQPVFPDQFAIQLYNPDTQIVVKQQTAKWSGTVSWEFSLPQISFRMPSASALDRTQTDPSADIHTPRVNLAWRKEGRYGKDMTCYLTGKSTDPTGKKAKKNKEPDIAVALFSGLKEMTIMEPNLYRVEIEDYKGLEVALLLSAAVIRDMFFSNPRDTFHIADKVGGGMRARKGSSPLEGPGFTPPVMTPQPPPPPAYTGPSQYPPEKVSAQSAPAPASVPAPAHARAPAPAPAQYRQPHPPPFATNTAAAKRTSLPPLQTQPQPQQPPRTNHRTQREIDAETARLKAQIEAEERERKRQEEAVRKARRRQEAEEERQTRQFLENERKQKEREDKERRRKQAEVDAETERLRKQFGDQSNLLAPQRPAQQPQRQRLSWQTQRPAQPPRTQQRPAPVPTQPGPHMGAHVQPGSHRPTASHSSFFGGQPKPSPQPMKAKKSFWGLRTSSETTAEKLKKKKSSMF
jgi:hypothetical protein